jgi:hypothetical protein
MNLAGFIVERAGKFAAFDPNHKLIGSFVTQLDAMRAIPPVPTERGASWTPREHRHRRAANLRKPKTAMAAAFLKALFAWSARHANDDNTQIVIPTGFVSLDELRQVICALLAARRAP